MSADDSGEAGVHLDQFYQCRGVHLAHQLSAMNFDRYFAEMHLGGYLLVHHAAGYHDEERSLVRRQGCISRTQVAIDVLLFPMDPVIRYRGADRIEHVFT